MRFDHLSAVAVMVGFFVLSPIFVSFMAGDLRWTFNYLFNGSLGIFLAIVTGIFFGYLERRK